MKSNLSEKIYTEGQLYGYRGVILTKDAKKHTKNAQRRLKKLIWILPLPDKPIKDLEKKIDKIFLEEFGRKLI